MIRNHKFSKRPQSFIYSFIYLGFYVAFNTVQVISRWVVGRAEESSTYSSSGFCTVNCRPTVSKYQLSHLRPCWEPNSGLRGGRRECCHYATMAPLNDPSQKSVFYEGFLVVDAMLPCSREIFTSVLCICSHRYLLCVDYIMFGCHIAARVKRNLFL